MPRTWFQSRRNEIRVASLSLVSFRYLLVMDGGRPTSYISISSFRSGNIYHIRFLSSSRSLEFSSLEVKYDIFGHRDEWAWQRHSVEYSQHNIVDPYPQACLRHLADERSLHDGRVHTHTHTHTHTYTHTYTQHFSQQDCNTMMTQYYHWSKQTIHYIYFLLSHYYVHIMLLI